MPVPVGPGSMLGRDHTSQKPYKGQAEFAPKPVGFFCEPISLIYKNHHLIMNNF